MRLESYWAKGEYLCVGLDTDIARIPADFLSSANPGKRILEYNKIIVDATIDFVIAYKPNIAFYESIGDGGIAALRNTIGYIRSRNSSTLVIIDAKRGDIDTSSAHYAHMMFDQLDADATTVSPYMGRTSLEPFLDRKDKGTIILAKTSNTGAAEFQNMICDGIPLYQQVAKAVATKWNTHGNCGLVAGATYPGELYEIRRIVGPRMPLLLPGVGAQGADLRSALVASTAPQQRPAIIVNVSRDIVFASETDFPNAAREKAKKYRDRIREYFNSLRRDRGNHGQEETSDPFRPSIVDPKLRKQDPWRTPVPETRLE